MHTAEKTKKPQLLKLFISALIPAALLCVFYILSSKRSIMNAIQDKFSLPALRFLGKTFSKIPVSILEIFIAIAIISAVIFIFKFIFLKLIIFSLTYLYRFFCKLLFRLIICKFSTHFRLYQELYTLLHFEHLFSKRANRLNNLRQNCLNAVILNNFKVGNLTIILSFLSFNSF